MGKIIYKIGKALTSTDRPNVDRIAQLLEARGYADTDPEMAASRFVRYIASEEKCDSVGDVIKAGGWDVDDWHKNPAMFADHDHSVSAKIAQGLQAFVDGKRLVVDCFYLPPDVAPNGLAEACYKMVRAGYLPDCSVGPIPTEYHYADASDKTAYGEDAWRVWDKTILKELSAVGIGALNSAKVDRVAKGLKDGSLNDDDLKALQESGSEHLVGLVERALFRVKAPVSVTTKSFPAPSTSTSPMDAVTKRLEEAAKSADAAAKRLELATKLSQKAAQGLVIPLTIDNAEKMLMSCNVIAETLMELMPTQEEPDGDEENESEDPIDPFEDSKASGETVLNKAAFSNAKKLIAAGKVDRDSKWGDAFGTEEENALLGEDGDDWNTYGKWFLAIHTDAAKETKARYGYPFGKDGKVFRSGVIAIKTRASQQNETDIADAADKLLAEIDKDEDGDKSLATELQRRLAAARL